MGGERTFCIFGVCVYRRRAETPRSSPRSNTFSFLGMFFSCHVEEEEGEIWGKAFFPGVTDRVRAQLRPPAIDVRPRHFPWKSAESERFAPSNHSAARSPATRLLHTMKTICESCCDSPATLVACGREGTVLCGTCDTPRYAPADVTFFFAPASATRPSMGHPRRPRKTVEHPSWRRTRHARTRR